MEKKILIVDDVQFIRTMIKKGLSEFRDIKIIESDSGMECMELLKSGRYDLLILDMCLDDKEGLEIIEELKNENITMPVIGISADAAKLEEAKNYKMVSVVKKPLDFNRLNNLIKGVLELK